MSIGSLNSLSAPVFAALRFFFWVYVVFAPLKSEAMVPGIATWDMDRRETRVSQNLAARSRPLPIGTQTTARSNGSGKHAGSSLYRAVFWDDVYLPVRGLDGDPALTVGRVLQTDATEAVSLWS